MMAEVIEVMFLITVVLFPVMFLYCWSAARKEEHQRRDKIKKYFGNPGNFMSDYDLAEEFLRRVTVDPTGFWQRVATKESWAQSLAAAVLGEQRHAQGRSAATMPEIGRPEGLRPFVMEAGGISSPSPVGGGPPLMVSPTYEPRSDSYRESLAVVDAHYGAAGVAAAFGPAAVDALYGSGMVAAFYGAPSTQPVWDQHRDSSRRGGIGDA